MLPAVHATELAAAADMTVAVVLAADDAGYNELVAVSASFVHVHDCDARDQTACCAGEHAGRFPLKRPLVQVQIAL